MDPHDIHERHGDWGDPWWEDSGPPVVGPILRFLAWAIPVGALALTLIVRLVYWGR